MAGRVRLERDQRDQREDEARRRSRRSRASRRAAGQAPEASAPIDDRARERRREHEPGAVVALIPAAPAARRRRSAGGGGASRRSGRGRPSTSQAATTITISAKIWPSPLPHMREKPISARLAAFSISSRQSRITSGLRRISTPPAPIAKISALTARYQAMLTARPTARIAPPASAIVAGPGRPRPRADRRRHSMPRQRRAPRCPSPRPRRAAREHDRADGGDEQQEGGDLERRSRKLVSSSVPIWPGVPKVRARTRRARRRADRLQPEPSSGDEQLDERARRRAARQAQAAPPAAERRLRRSARAAARSSPTYGDDEHVEHHHRAGVDDDLRGGDELGAQQQEQHREREQVRRRARARCRRGSRARPRRSRRRCAPIAAMKKMTSTSASRACGHGRWHPTRPRCAAACARSARRAASPW